MKIDVMFRTEKEGNVLAYFPYEIHNGYVATCYAHIGQHSACDHEYIIKETKPCLEFKELKIELESIGYELNIIKKRNYNKFINAVNAAKRKYQ
jgi:hypothetical protein